MSQTLEIGQRQTTILMNHPMGAVEWDYTSDSSSGIKSGQCNVGERDAIKLLVCVQEILISVHTTYPLGWRPSFPRQYTQGGVGIGFPHLKLMSVFNLHTDIGFIEKVRVLTLRMMGFMGAI